MRAELHSLEDIEIISTTSEAKQLRELRRVRHSYTKHTLCDFARVVDAGVASFPPLGGCPITPGTPKSGGAIL